MADKEKRLRKILFHANLKGKLKSVKTYEESSIVVVEDPCSASKNIFFDKKGFEYALLGGETFPEDRVHFLVSTNPRNRQLVERSVMCNNYGMMERPRQNRS